MQPSQKEHRLKKSSIIVLAILYKITYKNIPKCTKFLEKRFCVINTHKFVYNENGLSKVFRGLNNKKGVVGTC